MALPDKNSIDGAMDAVLRLDQLPPLPLAATRLIEATADPDIEIRALATIIEQDPPLTARVLSLANSAFFGQTTPVLSVHRAIVQVLGLRMVRDLSLVMAVAGSFDTCKCRQFDPDEYWLRALLTASVAAAIGRRAGKDGVLSVDALYLSGLLHNIGVLVLVHVRPDEMSNVFDQAKSAHSCDPVQIEQSLLGIDHWQAGEWIAYRWHLPDVVVDTLAKMVDPLCKREHAAVADVVRAASFWAADYLNDGESQLRVPGLSEPTAHAAQNDVVTRLDGLRAMAAVFSQQVRARSSRC